MKFTSALFQVVFVVMISTMTKNFASVNAAVLRGGEPQDTAPAEASAGQGHEQPEDSPVSVDQKHRQLAVTLCAYETSYSVGFIGQEISVPVYQTISRNKYAAQALITLAKAVRGSCQTSCPQACNLYHSDRQNPYEVFQDGVWKCHCL